MWGIRGSKIGGVYVGAVVVLAAVGLTADATWAYGAALVLTLPCAVLLLPALGVVATLASLLPGIPADSPWGAVALVPMFAAAALLNWLLVDRIVGRFCSRRSVRSAL